MKTVVITGGSDGLGKEIAHHLSNSTNIYILSRNDEVLKTVASELTCNYKVCDVTNYTNLESVFAEIFSESGA